MYVSGSLKYLYCVNSFYLPYNPVHRNGCIVTFWRWKLRNRSCQLLQGHTATEWQTQGCVLSTGLGVFLLSTGLLEKASSDFPRKSSRTSLDWPREVLNSTCQSEPKDAKKQILPKSLKSASARRLRCSKSPWLPEGNDWSEHPWSWCPVLCADLPFGVLSRAHCAFWQAHSGDWQAMLSSSSILSQRQSS
jgi:hypothetical protein